MQSQQIGLLVLLLLVLALGPLVTIWSINTLFDVGIDFSFKTWLAATWFFGIALSAAHNSS